MVLSKERGVKVISAHLERPSQQPDKKKGPMLASALFDGAEIPYFFALIGS
jgi:hypothetical protein